MSIVKQHYLLSHAPQPAAPFPLLISRLFEWIISFCGKSYRRVENVCGWAENVCVAGRRMYVAGRRMYAAGRIRSTGSAYFAVFLCPSYERRSCFFGPKSELSTIRAHMHKSGVPIASSVGSTD